LAENWFDAAGGGGGAGAAGGGWGGMVWALARSLAWAAANAAAKRTIAAIRKLRFIAGLPV
jgi:hypothetical protein